MNSTSTAQTTNGGYNVLLRNFGGVYKKRRILESSKISKQENEAIVSFYDALVSRKEIEAIDLRVIKGYFPSFDDVNVDMIIEEAFPAFERTIGKENFAKVKRYFGIGVRANKFSTARKDIEMLISKLRTIENAQYYLAEYKELIAKVAKKLEGAPEGMSEIEKAKVVRMYLVLFCGFFYFCEDYSYSGIDYNRVQKNNKMGFYPEEMFCMYASKLNKVADESFFYEVIFREFTEIGKNPEVEDSQPDKNLIKRVLEFAELQLVENKFVSTNNANLNQTFASVRKIKIELHREPGVFPIELFGELQMLKKFDFGHLYCVYDGLTNVKLEDFDTEDMPFMRFEGSRIIETKYPCYKIFEGMYIAGPIEKSRFIHLMELAIKRNIQIPLIYEFTGEKRKEPKMYYAKQFMNAIKFARDSKYLKFEDRVEKEFAIVDELIKKDEQNALLSYSDENLSAQEMRERLGIDETFEIEHLGFKPEVSFAQVVANFAIKSGYAKAGEIDFELIENVFVAENEGFIELYHENMFTEKEFEKAIGFDSEFAEMFFNLSKINFEAIEQKLLEVKRTSTVGSKKIGHNFRMLVLLYCYITVEQIPCGPKNRVPKRNKALKPSNLRKFAGIE